MKVQVTQALRFKKADGAIELKTGDIVTLPDSKALQLIKGGKALQLPPEECSGCWAEDNGMCYALIKGRICYNANCEYKH